MNAKIREHAKQKVPFQLVLGDEEVEAHEVNVRVRARKKPKAQFRWMRLSSGSRS